MSFALDLLYVAICLAVSVTGLALTIHLRGEHAHAHDCVACRRLHRLFRIR